MKRIIDIPEPGFNACKLWVEMGVATWQDEIIAKSTPLLSVTNAEQAEAFPIIDQEEKGDAEE